MIGIPKLNKLCDELKDKVEFVGIARGDRESTLREAIKVNGIKWKNYFENNKVAAKYGITGYPTKILIGPDGKILYRCDGENADFYEEVLKYLK